MRINLSNLESVLSANLNDTDAGKMPVSSEENLEMQTDYSSANSLHALDGQMRKLQLLQKFATSNTSTSSASLKTNSASTVKRISSSGIDEETKRILENYHRQIKPSEIKGARPPEGSRTSGHATAKHDVKTEVQAKIMNQPERIFSGVNDNNRYVDIYYKDGSVVITEFGNKERVITAYGMINQRDKAKPINPEKFASNSRYVEIKLEQKGATTVIYPNKPRFDADDFPKNPPRPETVPPKTNGGSTSGTLPVSEPTTGVTTNVQEPPIASQPPVATRVPPEDAPAMRPGSSGGAITEVSENLNRGIILLQLVQIGVGVYNASQAKTDGEKYGYFVDPFMGRYVLTDPEKAAQNLPEGFELKFYFDPMYPYSPERSVTFTVKDGKFVNIDKNYPDYKLYKDEKGTVQAGILS